MAYTCPVCGMTSQNPNDETERYCGNCHKFEDRTMSDSTWERRLDEQLGRMHD